MIHARRLLVSAAGAALVFGACSESNELQIDATTTTSGAENVVGDAAPIGSDDEPGTLPPVTDSNAGDSIDDEPAPMPDLDTQLWLRTQWQYTVGDGPGRIEADVGVAARARHVDEWPPSSTT